MFYQHVEQQWKAGKVSVGLPTLGHGKSVSLEGTGITRLAIAFLSEPERRKIADLAREDAIAKRDAGTRPEVNRAEIVQRLQGYDFVEIAHALEVLSESDSVILELEEVRSVWDRVSVALDHHDSEQLPALQHLEKELAEAGRFGE